MKLEKPKEIPASLIGHIVERTEIHSFRGELLLGAFVSTELVFELAIENGAFLVPSHWQAYKAGYQVMTRTDSELHGVESAEESYWMPIRVNVSEISEMAA